MMRYIAFAHIASERRKDSIKITFAVSTQASQDGIAAPSELKIGKDINAAQAQHGSVSGIDGLSILFLFFVASSDNRPFWF